MNITLIAEPSSNPVLDTALDLLRERHTVAVLDPKSLSPWGFRPEPSGRRDGDMVLLKSRTAEARSWAHHAERAGAVVVNTPTATDTGEAADRAVAWLDALSPQERLRRSGLQSSKFHWLPT